MRTVGRRASAFSGAFALTLLCLRPAGAVESRFRLLIQKVFPQAQIQDDAAREDEQNYRFQVFNEEDGYARVVGPFKGRQDFFLIRGELRDLLISVEYLCGPACGQRLIVHRFDAGAEPTRIPLMDLLDLSRFPAVRRRLMRQCLDSEGNFSTQADEREKAHRQMPDCPFVLSFPKKNSPAVLFKVINEDASDIRLSVGKTMVSPKVQLRWNGIQFVGAAPRGGSILLGDEKMRAFF